MLWEEISKKCFFYDLVVMHSPRTLPTAILPDKLPTLLNSSATNLGLRVAENLETLVVS